MKKAQVLRAVKRQPPRTQSLQEAEAPGPRLGCENWQHRAGPPKSAWLQQQRWEWTPGLAGTVQHRPAEQWSDSSAARSAKAPRLADNRQLRPGEREER